MGQRVDNERLEVERPDWEEDVIGRRCRSCKKVFYIKRGRKVRCCPFCGAAQEHGAQTQMDGDPRRTQPLRGGRAREL